MANESSQLVLAFFDNEDAADEAAAALKKWDKATDEIKLGNVGVLAKSEGGKVKQHKLGPRSGKKGAGIGLVLGIVAAPFTAGISLLGATAAGGIFGSAFHKGLPKADVERISAELEAGHAAVGALVEKGDAAQVTAKLAELGGKPEAHEVSDEVLQEVAATAQEATPAEDATPAEVAAVAAIAEADTESAAAVRLGKYEVYHDHADKFRWRLKATNGRIIATGSVGYTSQASCDDGINSVKANAPTAEVVVGVSDEGQQEAAEPAALTAWKFDLYRDAAGEYRWRLKAADGHTIATGGEGYTSRAHCENGIHSVKVNAPTDEVVAV